MGDSSLAKNWERRDAFSDLEANENEQHGISMIRSLSNGLAASLIGILLSAVTVIVVVFISSARLDAYANEKSVEQVQRLLALELDKLADLSLEYAWWNEAVDMVGYERDIEWADINVGGYLQERYNIQLVLSFDPNGELAFGKSGDDLLQAVPEAVMTPELKSLLKKAIATDFRDPQPVSDIIGINGAPALIATSTFAVYAPTEREIDRSHGVLVLIKMLNQELLSSWSEDFQIRSLSIAPVGSAAETLSDGESITLALKAADGQSLGHVYWKPDYAGDRFLAMVLPWASVAVLLILLASVIFYSKLKRYSRVAINHFMELVSSRKVLLRQAKFDFLTGLANRPLFLETVMQEMNRCIRHNEHAAVVYMDLDNFKAVNDSLGHDTGDELLYRVAEYFQNSIRQEDTVARFGGDEFCLLLTGITGPSDVERVLATIHDKFSTPFSIGDRTLFVGVSAGIVMIPDDTTDCSTVFRFSDIAMYTAKAKGQNGYCFYNDDLAKLNNHRANLRTLLSSALDKEELHLKYQPVYALSDRTVKGFEALLRWQSDELGEVSPAEFIPVAEETGIIDQIGLWVVEQALKDLRRIDASAGGDLSMSINVSVKQLSNPQFPSKLDELRKHNGIDVSRIRLEITESILISEQDKAHNVLLELSERGYKLALDDFGTGYSALGYLQRYPLEMIKIDKSFISGGDTPDSSASLVKTIVYMAETMGMKTVAEGIETPEQEAFVRAIGCSYGQGYLFSHPERYDRIINLIQSHDSRSLS
jgi:diguanylate cyclase (GGDEF)-like protein